MAAACLQGRLGTGSHQSSTLCAVYLQPADHKFQALVQRSARAAARMAAARCAPPCAGRTAGRGIRQHTTGVAFGAHGDKLSAIYHADHVYAFDITGSSADASARGQAYPFRQDNGRALPAAGITETPRSNHLANLARDRGADVTSSM